MANQGSRAIINDILLKAFRRNDHLLIYLITQSFAYP